MLENRCQIFSELKGSLSAIMYALITAVGITLRHRKVARSPDRVNILVGTLFRTCWLVELKKVGSPFWDFFQRIYIKTEDFL